MRDLRIKIFADGADLAQMLEMGSNPLIKGFTTNPTLMRKAGVSDYRTFARALLDVIPDRPISFEVLSDDFEVMYQQAIEISSWGRNVYAKVPITDTRGASSAAVLERLSAEGVAVNVTALATVEQVEQAASAMARSPAGVISVFAGRIADTGRDPVPMMERAVEILAPFAQLELLWASPRELLNVFQANDVGCHIVTATNDILKKLELVGKDLAEYSLDTVKMFVLDAELSGLEL